MKHLPRALALIALLPVLVRAQSYTWTVHAGVPPPIGSADGPARDARFHWPAGMVFDPAGNLYVCDMANHTIRKIAPDGSATTLAGLAGASGSTDGTGAAARFFSPASIAIDAARNLYVADRTNYTIRKITPAGAVSTLAGLPRTLGSTDGTGSDARFYLPWGIAAAPDGTVFVSDRLNHTIRRISPAGAVTTLAGLAGTSGYADGNGADVRFYFPTGLVLAPDGSLFVADSNNYAIRRIAPDGAVSIFAGTARSIGSTNGTGAAARFSVIYEMAMDAAGDLFVADASYNTIRKVTPAAVVTTLAGSPTLRGSANGIGNVARFCSPYGIAAGADGNLYVADTWNQTIRRIAAGGLVSDFSGPGGNFGSNDGPGATARFNFPHGAGFDGDGNLYVADSRNTAIRRISPEGMVSTHARLPSSNYWGLFADTFDNLIITDRTAHTLRVASLSNPANFVDVGTPGRPGSTDGPVNTASFNQPYAVTTDPRRAIIYIADTGNHVIRRIVIGTASVTVSTFAGTAGSLGAVDGTGAASRFNRPQGVATDPAGNVYVADTGNHTIRLITPAGVVTTLAGAAGLSGTTNATGASARFSTPASIAVDQTGTVFVTDDGSNLIRRVSPTRSVTTIGGLVGSGSDFAEGTGSAARYNEPVALAVDSAGAVYVVDAGNNVVMKGVLDTPPAIVAPPQSLPVLPGTPVTLAVGATGGGLRYQWRFNGTALPGATSATHAIASAQSSNAGAYTVDITNSAGGVSSTPAALSLVPTANVGRIVNLAIRSQAGTGAQTLIVGIGIGGTGVSGNKPVLIRCVGPALGAFGVLNALVDPRLELYAGATKSSENDNWNGDAQVAAIGGQVGAFPLGAASARDAALYLPALVPGSYTVQMSGVAGSTGVVLAEIYDATRNDDYTAATPRLVNVSARTQVGTEGDVLIAGFVVGGLTAKTVLIRAIGPTLGSFGVASALADPKLELYAGATKINENDNWGGGSGLSSAFASVGAFPLVASTRDAVLLVTLAPGGYTAQVSGAGAGTTTGVALVEVYEVP